VEVAPDDRQTRGFSFACTCGEFESVAAPAIFVFGDAKGLQFGSCPTKFGDDLGE